MLPLGIVVIHEVKRRAQSEKRKSKRRTRPMNLVVFDPIDFRMNIFHLSQERIKIGEDTFVIRRVAHEEHIRYIEQLRYAGAFFGRPKSKFEIDLAIVAR